MHSVDGAPANLPLAHAVHVAALYVVLIDPCGQCWQMPCWLLTMYRPGTHAGVGYGVGYGVGNGVGNGVGYGVGDGVGEGVGELSARAGGGVGDGVGE